MLLLGLKAHQDHHLFLPLSPALLFVLIMVTTLLVGCSGVPSGTDGHLLEKGAAVARGDRDDGPKEGHMPQQTSTAQESDGEGPITNADAIGDWRLVQGSPDPITDDSWVAIALASSLSVFSDYSPTPDPVMLIATCRYGPSISENTITLTIAWNGEFTPNLPPKGFYGELSTEVRFDDAEVTTEHFSITDRVTTETSDYGHYAHSLKTAERLAIRARHNAATVVTAQFNLKGFTEAVRPLEVHCLPGS